MADKKEEYCSPCIKLKKQNPDFWQNGITDKACNSLKENTGLDSKNGHKDCEDLHDMNDCLLEQARKEMNKLDWCNPKTLYRFLKDYICKLHALLKAIICAICGLWEKVEDLMSQNWAINTRYIIEYSTPEMSVSINRTNGDFIFKFSDWQNPNDPSTRLGRGEIRGTVNFGMRKAKNGAFDWQIREVVVKNIKYVTSGKPKVSDFRINIYVKKDGEQTVYSRQHDATKNFTDTINKTIPVNTKGTVNKGQSSGWMQFLEVFNDNLATTMDDRANVQIEFKNNNQGTPPKYVD